jgi:hypothetical protein
MRVADRAPKEPQVVVDLGRGPDGGPGGLGGVLLLDGDRRGEPVDESTSGFSMRSRNCRAYDERDST